MTNTFYKSFEKNLSISNMRPLVKNWFDKGAMDFFNTVIETKANLNFFVTSDRYDENVPKKYSIRYFTRGTRKINTIGNFQQFDTLEEAKKEANKLSLLFEVVRLKGGWLENHIIENVSNSSFENGLYELECIVDDEYKKLKLDVKDIKNMTFTF